MHLPFHQSDHALSLAYNALGGLEDLERLRNGEVYLDALGAQRIPNPTTAGVVCRRFEADDVDRLMDGINEVRLRVCNQTASPVLGKGDVVECVPVERVRARLLRAFVRPRGAGGSAAERRQTHPSSSRRGPVTGSTFRNCTRKDPNMTKRSLSARRIATKPDWFEPFRIAQGYRVGDLLVISGQASLDEQGRVVGVGDFAAQAHQVFQCLKRVLEAGGSSLDRVIKVTIYLTDMSHFSKIVELRERYFSPPYPADTIVEVRALALPELMIEIEALALAEGEISD